MDQQAGRQVDFYSRPCGRGDALPFVKTAVFVNFYSRPCGRGDADGDDCTQTPLISTHAPAGGATIYARYSSAGQNISTHAPAGGATSADGMIAKCRDVFLLTPLREGRLHRPSQAGAHADFYSRPCGRGDHGRRPEAAGRKQISTHAPAGGATAIFHKSVMRFCGKLPKDDTVLCLASFGFPRRDPKAVYLAWISCANLPQKCVRQGLALKDQGTSCFHEGLASHAFDPVLV